MTDEWSVISSFLFWFHWLKGLISYLPPPTSDALTNTAPMQSCLLTQSLYLHRHSISMAPKGRNQTGDLTLAELTTERPLTVSFPPYTTCIFVPDDIQPRLVTPNQGHTYNIQCSFVNPCPQQAFLTLCGKVYSIKCDMSRKSTAAKREPNQESNPGHSQHQQTTPFNSIVYTYMYTDTQI